MRWQHQLPLRSVEVTVVFVSKLSSILFYAPPAASLDKATQSFQEPLPSTTKNHDLLTIVGGFLRFPIAFLVAAQMLRLLFKAWTNPVVFGMCAYIADLYPGFKVLGGNTFSGVNIFVYIICLKQVLLGRPTFVGHCPECPPPVATDLLTYMPIVDLHSFRTN